jgi:hypothetical protein
LQATRWSYPDSGVEDDAGFRKRRERLRRLLRRVEALLGETDTALEAMTSEAPNVTGLGRLERLRSRLEASVQDYLLESTAILEYTREQVRKIDEANRKAAAMTEQRSSPARDQARIQKLSEEFSRELRLDRVDAAIKELLNFLSDADFFAANASTGRRRRLRALQNAIDKALQI